MEFQWIAVALGDVTWISIAFILGLLARSVGVPPLVGFLAAGFLLNAYGIASGEMLENLSSLGITLLLFTVGLKLNLRTLARPQVWAVSGLHMAIISLVFAVIVYVLALGAAPFFAALDIGTAFLIAFALSFSSTVFVVKLLEDRGEVASLHGRIAVGILIMQDIAAVVFLAVSAGEWPTIWALGILLIVPLRPILFKVLERVGHDELLVLYGFLLAMGGAALFKFFGLKGDLGALVLGLMLANHAKADELAKTMFGFKDLFLLGFFLSIGLSGQLTPENFLAGALITPLIFLKAALFLPLLTRFNLRARTSLLASLSLMNFSEFGLIVVAAGIASGWIDQEWIVILAIALSLSFVIAAALNTIAQPLYRRHAALWSRLQRAQLIPDDQLLDTRGATIAIIGMGGIGSGAFDAMQTAHGETVVGVDIDPITSRSHRSMGRNVLHGDPSDADFWDRVQAAHKLELVMLALPKLSTNLAVLKQLKAAGFTGRVAVIAKFQDEVDALRQAGADTVFNIYTEAGAGFAAHVMAD